MKTKLHNRRNKAGQISRYLLIFVVFVGIAGFACQDGGDTNNSVTAEFGLFEIYLVSDWVDTVATTGGITDLYSRLEELDESGDIGNIVIVDKPLITVTDIVFYDWDNHSIKLTSEATNRLNQAGYGNGMHVPFIIVANGERIYFGAFWPGYSSYMPKFPSIWYLPTIFPCYLPPKDNMGCILQLHGPETILSDHRVYDALKQANLLLECEPKSQANNSTGL